MYDRLVEAERAVHEMRRQHKVRALLDLEKLLGVVRRLKDKAEFLRSFYADVNAMSEALFKDNATAANVRREVEELREGWEKKLKELQATDLQHPGIGVIQRWQGTTETFGERLFTCYSHPRLPRTNNHTEQTISSLKQLVRTVSGKPNPAKRFKRQGATLAVFLNRDKLPGEAFINSRRPPEFDLARKLIAARQRERSVEYKARTNLKGLLSELQERFSASKPPY